MAQADFDFVIFSTDAFIDGPQGSALYHPRLTSPLTEEGPYGREWHSTTASGRLKALVNDANYVGIPNTQSISIRSWLRVNSSTLSTSLGLIARTTAGDTDNGGGLWEGYSLQWRWANSGNIALGLYAKAVGSGTGGATTVAGEITLGLANQWSKVRLDVIPLLDGNDLLKAFTGVGATGEEVWTERLSVTVPSVAAYHCPATPTSRVGLWVNTGSSAAAAVTYFDRFQVFIEDV